MRLFIDTNSWHGPLRSGENEGTLKALLGLVKSKNVSLILTKQVFHEYIRNRTALFKDATDENNKELKKISDEMDVIKSSLKDKFGEFLTKKQIDDLSAIFKKSSNKAKKTQRLLHRNRVIADKTIEKIFACTVVLDESSGILERAQVRVFRGDPPWPNHKSQRTTGGDAINWEFLLENAIDDDLALITNDRDFGEEADDIDTILRYEWRERTKKSLTIYRTIGDFVNANSSKKVVTEKQVEIEKETLSTLSEGIVNVYPNSVHEPYNGLYYPLQSASFMDAARAAADYLAKFTQISERFSTGFSGMDIYAGLGGGLSSLTSKNMTDAARVLQEAAKQAQRFADIASMHPVASTAFDDHLSIIEKNASIRNENLMKIVKKNKDGAN